MAIDPILQDVYSLVEQMLPLLGQTQQQTIDVAPKGETDAILTLLQSVSTEVDNLINASWPPTNQFYQMEATLLDKMDTILTAIAAAQQAGSPVTLPSTPPSGYGGLDAGATGSAVWDFVEVGSSRSQGYWQVLMGNFGLNMGTALVPFRNPNSPHILASTDWEYPQPTLDVNSWPQASVNNILSTDDLVTWLERETGMSPWTDGGSGYYTIYSGGPSDFNFWCDLSATEFAILKNSLYPSGSTTVVAPVWPGLANVTLGSPVALDDGLTIAGPLDGLLIEIDSVPPPIGYYAFGTFLSYVKVGGVVFIDDNGQAENAIPLGPQLQNVCPTTMQHAASATIRCKSGCTGTVTPWTAT